jgi:hypothetical protein
MLEVQSLICDIPGPGTIDRCFTGIEAFHNRGSAIVWAIRYDGRIIYPVIIYRL